MKLNDRVYITKVKKIGVIKEFLPDGKAKVTYFDKNDKRRVINVTLQDIEIPKSDNKYYHLVKQFQKAFGHPVGVKPAPLTPERTVTRSGWKVEEIIENLHAVAKDQEEFSRLYEMLIASADKTYMKLYDKPKPTNTLAAQVDALTDELYFLIGDFVEIALLPDKFVDIVHGANINKLWDDGLPRYKDGKVIKPDSWVAPDKLIEEEVERQLKRG
jgi:predicted HAD superfamily Cof-like phosphohydrolase